MVHKSKRDCTFRFLTQSFRTTPSVLGVSPEKWGYFSEELYRALGNGKSDFRIGIYTVFYTYVPDKIPKEVSRACSEHCVVNSVDIEISTIWIRIWSFNNKYTHSEISLKHVLFLIVNRNPPTIFIIDIFQMLRTSLEIIHTNTNIW